MRLTRREILEQLGRLGIRRPSDMKRACREYEAYWDCLGCEYGDMPGSKRKNDTAFPGRCKHGEDYAMIYDEML